MLKRHLIIIAATAVLISLLFLTRPGPQADLRPPSPMLVKAVAVRHMALQPYRTVTGKLRPAQTAHLRFQVSGYLVERSAEPGTYVEKGEPVLQIDSGDYVDTVAEAEAVYQQEVSAVERDRRLLQLVTKERELLAKEVDRLARLEQGSLASRSRSDAVQRSLLQKSAELARLRHSVQSGKARLSARRAVLTRAQRNLSRTRLTAPFTGVVRNVYVDVGDFVTAGQPALDFVRLDELDAYLEIPGRLTSSLALGQRVDVQVESRVETGTIVALAPDPEASTNTHELRVRLSGEGLHAGQLVDVRLPGRYFEDAAVVPVTAVLQEAGQAFVFLVQDDRVSKTPVQLLARDMDRQVVSGLKPGDRVIARDVAALTDGQSILTGP